MESFNDFEQFRNQVQPALTSKKEEFSLYGYNQITENDIWNFLAKKKWRKLNEHLMLHEIVQAIFNLKVGEYMNFASIEALKSTDFSFENDEDRLELLK